MGARGTLLLFCAALACSQSLESQTITGRVSAPRGAPIAGARVEARLQPDTLPRRAAVTDGAGTFRLRGLAPGSYLIRATRIGFATTERTVTLHAGAELSLDLVMAEGAVAVEGVDVTARPAEQRERTRFETEAGITTRVIDTRDIKILPGLGEADVLRAVEVLPGVVSTSDFSSAFNVRGGSADQNLILLDGFPIFNPFHLGGLFSVFNSDVIARAELMAGGFGADYGGRVSSVLNVESVAGSADGAVHADAGVSILATRVAVRGGLPGQRDTTGRTGWVVSGRRSYFDVLLSPVLSFPYHLTDLQAGVTVPTRGGGRLRFTGYWGEDVLDLTDFEAPGGGDEGILRVRWGWGNSLAGVHWQQPAGAWSTDLRLGWSRYHEGLRFVEFGDTRFASEVDQLALRADAGRSLGPRLRVATGMELGTTAYSNLAAAGGTVFFEGDRRGTLAAGYGQLRWEPAGGWLVEPGVRVDRWDACRRQPCTLVSPRFAVKRFLGAERDAAAKLSIGRYVQFVHSLRDENLPISNDTWVTADEHVPAVRSDQVQLGVEKYWDDRWYASAEGYYRRFRGVTEFNVADDPNDPADDLLAGSGRAYGMDLLLRRSSGRLTGWTTLSLLRATRRMPDPAAAGIDSVPGEVSYPPIFDRRVDLDVVARYAVSGRMDLGVRVNFGTGVPYTRPIAQVAAFETDLVGSGYRLHRPVGEDRDLPLYVVPGDRNRWRYPAYSRLDVTLRRTYPRRWGTLTPYLQVLNATNRQNVLFYFYDFSGDPPTRSGFSMFPLLPTIGVEAKF